MKGCQVPILTSAIKSFVPTAKLTSDTEEELVFSLGEDKTRFPALLEELSTKKELLKVNHVGLSQTTMEQVFLRYLFGLEDGISNIGICKNAILCMYNFNSLSITIKIIIFGSSLKCELCDSKYLL